MNDGMNNGMNNRMNNGMNNRAFHRSMASPGRWGGSKGRPGSLGSGHLSKGAISDFFSVDVDGKDGKEGKEGKDGKDEKDVGVREGDATAVLGAFQRSSPARLTSPDRKKAFRGGGGEAGGGAGVDHRSALKRFALEELKAATSNWADQNVLGDGGFAVVFLAVLKGEGRVAVKKVTMPKGKKKRDFIRKSMHAEREIMAHYSHQNICALIGSYVGSPEEPYCLVYEICEGGSLLERIGCRDHKENTVPALTEGQRVVIALGICRALEYLHVKANPPIIHRDVKSANCLLTNKACAKLADFGTVRQDVLRDNDTHVKTHTVVGTKCYM
jgi:hypothetical protein